MAFKPNYGQQRADRNRAKEQKKQEKLERRKAAAAEQPAEDAAPSPDGETPDQS